MEDYLTEALELLHGPAIEAEPARTTPAFDEHGRPIKAKKEPWIKFGVLFSRGTNSMNAKLSGGQVKTFIAIALRIDDTADCWPSIETIAKDSGQKERTVQRHLYEDGGLIELGLVSVTKRHGRTNVYSISKYAAYGTGNEPDQTPDTSVTPVTHDTPPPSPMTPKEEPVKKNQLDPPPKKQAEEEQTPPQETEYVDLDDDWPVKEKTALVKYIEQNAQRKLTDNQQNKLAMGVPKHNPRHPSPVTLFANDPDFEAYIDGKIAWATGGVDGQRRQTGRLISAICNYDHEAFGWLNFKQQIEEDARASPANQFRDVEPVPDEEDAVPPTESPVDWEAGRKKIREMMPT